MTANVSDAAEIFMSVVPYRIQQTRLPLRRDRWIIREGDGGFNGRGASVGKRKKSKAAFALRGLWSPSSSKHWYTHTQRHTGCLSLPLVSLSLSLSSASFISSRSLHLYPWLALGIPVSPSTYHSLTVQALISVRREINSILRIHFSSYHGFNNGNKAKDF